MGRRLYLLVPERTSGGGNTFITFVSEALASRGVETIQISSPMGLTAEDHVLAAGNSLPRTAARSAFWPLTVAPLEPDTRRLLGTTRREAAKWRAREVLLRRSCRLADSLIFSSEYARSLFRQRFPEISGTPSSVILPGARQTPAWDAQRSVDAPLRVLSVSHLYPYKMAHHAIEAIEILQHEGITVELSFVGNIPDASYAAQLHALVTERGLADQVQFLGAKSHEEIDQMQTEHDVFLFTSTSENASSYALLDAMHAGMPIVSSHFSSMPELLQDGGMYVNPRSPESIAIGLRALHDDPELARALGRNARRRVLDLPGPEDFGRLIVDHFAQLPQTA